MITLQNFIFPESAIATADELYFRTRGAVTWSRDDRSFSLGRDACLAFDTYFNLFSVAKWRTGCGLQDLFVEIRGRGRIELTVRYATSASMTEIACRKTATLDSGAPLLVDVSDHVITSPGGLVFVEIRALEDGVRIDGGRFATDRTRPAQLPKLAVSITTFKREAQVRATVDRLESWIAGFEFGEHVHVQVVDNGGTADIRTSDHVTSITNPNFGGSGGFARGLLEAQENGYSHCLFMDDDASFHMENISRAFIFLALSDDPHTAIAGSMITNLKNWVMWENGAWFDGVCRPLFGGTDLRDRLEVCQMEFGSLDLRPVTLYGGWWFFAFSVDAVQYYPFPFFVRGDDISFSLMNDFKIFTLNGVVSFQDDFGEKESALTLYLDLRNHLIQHLVTKELDRSALGTAKIAFRFILRSLVRFHYETAAAQLLAWQDVMEGPDFFDRNIDMAERRGRILSTLRTEAWHDVASADFSEKRRLTLWSKGSRRYLGLLTMNGHLVPFSQRRWDRIVVPVDKRGPAAECFGASVVTYMNASRSKCYTVRQSKARFFSIAFQTTATLVRFLPRFRRLKRDYRAGYARLASRSYWQSKTSEAGR